MEEQKQTSSFDDIKSIKIFDDVSFDVLLKEIYDRCTEDRQKALDVYDNIVKRFKEDDDIFILGDKANPYLDIAQKSTDNLTKMVTIIQKICSESKNNDKSSDTTSVDDLLSALDKMDIVPDALRQRQVI